MKNLKSEGRLGWIKKLIYINKFDSILCCPSVIVHRLVGPVSFISLKKVSVSTNWISMKRLLNVKRLLFIIFIVAVTFNWPISYLFIYRHVVLPKELVRKLPEHLMSEGEWRTIGVQQSRGWIHYMKHSPEPHILLFRRPLPEQQGTTAT